MPKFFDPYYTGRRYSNLTVSNATEVGIKVEGVPCAGKDIRAHNNPVGMDATDADIDVINLEID